MEIVKINENVHLHIYNTDKFKDVSIFIEFLDNSNKHDQTLRNLLALMLEDSSSLYNSKQAVSNLFNKLYGGGFSISFDIKGCARLMEVRSSFVNGKYVDDNKLLEKQFKVINEFLLRPLWIDKEYPKELFEELKEKLRQDISVLNDRPSSYSNKKADLLYGEYIGIKADMNISDLESIQVSDVIGLYNEIINKSIINIIVIGDVDSNDIKKFTKLYLNFENRSSTKEMVYKSNRSEFIEKEEKKKIGQTILQLRYKTNKNVLDSDFPSMIIGNGILGTLPTSLLFQEVREKRSLCYSISSIVYGYDGIMKISTGIDYSNLKTVKELISLQIDKIKTGDYDDSLLETTKKMYINVYRSNSDSAKSIMWDEYRNFIINDGMSIEKMIDEFKKVSKASIMESFKNLELVECYVLRQAEENNE